MLDYMLDKLLWRLKEVTTVSSQEIVQQTATCEPTTCSIYNLFLI